MKGGITILSSRHLALLGALGLAIAAQGSIPANDHFATRSVLAGMNAAANGNNAFATKEVGEPDPSLMGGKSVWWTWTAPTSGAATMTTAGSTFDTMLSVFTGDTLSNLTLVAFNDTETNTSSVHFNVYGGTAYHITVDGALNATGSVALQLTLGPALAVPLNDAFANATVLTGVNLNNIQGNNAGATREPGEPFHAEELGGKSIWYCWTAPAPGGLTLTTQNSAIDTLLAVYTGNSLSNLVFVAANDEDPLSSFGYESRVTCNVTAGTTYHIAIDGFDGDGGDTRLRLSLGALFPVPANDNFANRIPLAGNNLTTNGTNAGASFEPGEPLHVLALGGKSVWWSWTASANGRVTMDTAGSTVDTLLAVYKGTAMSNLTFVAGNDEDYLTATEGDSKVTFNVTAGTSYHIAVDGYDGSSGNITLRVVTGSALSVPANNDFANRGTISGTNTTVSGANAGASLEPGEPLHDASYGGKSVWWTWTAPAAGFVTMDTIGSVGDTLLAVYTGNVLSNLVEIASDDESGGNYTSLLTFPTRGNVTYQIAVDGYDGDGGALSLRVRFGAAAYALTVTTNPVAGGGIVVLPSPDQAGKYAPGALVYLTALPASQYEFAGWSGSALATANPLAITMNSNRMMMASFQLPPPRLTAVAGQTAQQIRTNGFRLSLTGPTNYLYALERSTNLTTWTSLQTNLISTSPYEIPDVTANDSAFRVYRARRLP